MATKAGKRKPTEKVRLRIGNLGQAVLVTGQAYQEPKDALNEFVSNAADEYALAGRRGERIRVLLRRRGRYPLVMVDDSGRGMGPERLRELARNLFQSSKAGDDTTIGEKAIGLLAFQQLGDRLEVVSRAEGSSETWVLKLHRGKATAELERERRRTRTTPGTTVYLAELDAEVLRMLTQRKVVEYLRKRRGEALRRGDYTIEVVEGRRIEVVAPEVPEGVKVPLATQRTLWGPIEFAVYVSPPDTKKRGVSVVGRGGTTIIDELAGMEDFDHPPWNTSQVSGQVLFEALRQSAGRRAILTDRDVYPLFVDALASVEPHVSRVLDAVNRQIDEATADRMSDTIRKIFDRVLKELDDLDNPMRTPLGTEPGEGGILGGTEDTVAPGGNGSGTGERHLPTADELTPDEPPSQQPQPAKPERARSSRLPTVAPDPHPDGRRSRFDPDERVVYYSQRHRDYLLVKDNEAMLLDYLATLVAKEYVVYNNPLTEPDELGEEMVRMLIRVRQHLPRRR
ncbi:MAG: hypothetical protein JJLCMIEE_01363 [Acidimicrobiales bacterium]|nr:MAG: ATP-binding protein [Actinomycetota bacterium]MBV6508303.1 hypothetical protein [Acidimicrobiales bacterium]RIK07086.1 MAG: hypothetical protein DCC48_04650 [Acidobacteriota bacterium]